jgi:deazaflavin-dependent oxidoreductase (nitroreductase family)
VAYLKPPALQRKVFNPLASRFGIGGSVSLVSRGRTSGDTHAVPVIPVTHDGTLYVVSARGETHWARNVRSSGRLELSRRGGPPEAYTAVEVPTADREPIIAAYRAKAGRAVDTYWKRLPDPADHPTFRLASE